MNQEHQGRIGLIVAVIIVALIVAGGITLWVIYPTADRTSFYIVAAAMVLSPIFVLTAYLMNRKTRAQRWGRRTNHTAM
jgi:hypothetical protein